MSVRGNVLWTPQHLVYIACLVALEQGPLVERFLDAREYLRSVCPHWKLGTSHGGWVEAHKREQERLIPAIKERLRQHDQALSSRAVASRWQALAVDGTNAACPRTRDNQAAMGDTGRPDGIPQLSMTLIQHVDTGLPWDFRVGSSDESERGHLRAMADDLPSDSLLVADAGFIGYDLCRELLEKRRHFLLRVGGNARLLQKLGYQSENDIPRVNGDDVADNKNLKVDVQVHVPDAVHREGQAVYLWPIQQQERREPPIRLRMIIVRDAEGIATSATLSLDLACLRAGLEGLGFLPRLLIHDSPRGGDLEPHLYAHLFTFAMELEAAFKEPPFQYILATTTHPPESLLKVPYLRLTLDARGQEGLLLKRRF